MTRTRTRTALALALALAGTALVQAPARADDGHEVFLPSAVEHPDHTVTLPLRPGHANNGDFWYVVLDASNSSAAARFGVNVAQKLSNAGTRSVQDGYFKNGVLHVGSGVDFAPVRSVGGGVPGSAGEYGYSPLVRLPDGTVIDAPQVANGTGLHDKVVDLSKAGGWVRLRETEGRSRGNVVHYVSTDASKAGPAALEGATLAPRLDYAPGPAMTGPTLRGPRLPRSPTAGPDRTTRSGRASRLRWPTGWTR